MKKKNLALAVAAAVVAGAVIYLFTSDNGKKIRKKAKEKGKNILSSVGSMVNDLKKKDPTEATS